MTNRILRPRCEFFVVVSIVLLGCGGIRDDSGGRVEVGDSNPSDVPLGGAKESAGGSTGRGAGADPPRDEPGGPRCIPQTCADKPGECGQLSDSCGSTIICACGRSEVCAAGTCCQPRTDCFGDCGVVSDGCNGIIDCGACDIRCPPGRKRCGGLCVSPDPNLGCDATSCSPCPPPPPNADGTCSGSECDFHCHPGYQKDAERAACVRASDAGANDAAGDSGST